MHKATEKFQAETLVLQSNVYDSSCVVLNFQQGDSEQNLQLIFTVVGTK